MGVKKKATGLAPQKNRITDFFFKSIAAPRPLPVIRRNEPSRTPLTGIRRYFGKVQADSETQVASAGDVTEGMGVMTGKHLFLKCLYDEPILEVFWNHLSYNKCHRISSPLKLDIFGSELASKTVLHWLLRPITIVSRSDGRSSLWTNSESIRHEQY